MFKAPSVRTDATAGEMAGLFYFLAKGLAALAGKIGGNVVFFELWRTGEYYILDNFLTVLILTIAKIFSH